MDESNKKRRADNKLRTGKKTSSDQWSYKKSN